MTISDLLYIFAKNYISYIMNTLHSLRKRASLLVSQTDSEELLSEAVAILSGAQLPCTYSYEQMEWSLREAEADYQKGNTESHETICQRYGV